MVAFRGSLCKMTKFDIKIVSDTVCPYVSTSFKQPDATADPETDGATSARSDLKRASQPTSRSILSQMIRFLRPGFHSISIRMRARVSTNGPTTFLNLARSERQPYSREWQVWGRMRASTSSSAGGPEIRGTHTVRSRASHLSMPSLMGCWIDPARKDVGPRRPIPCYRRTFRCLL
jgi:hypothetical protein